MLEVNFDGLVGPSHNYAGLSFGNVASAANAGMVSNPRAAALQGLTKMRHMIALGCPQGILLPHDRPDAAWLRSLGFSGEDEAVCRDAWATDPRLFTNACSASAMWTANAASVSPEPDTADGRTHLSVANLSSMVHRTVEPAQTARQLKLAFGKAKGVVVHDPLPAIFGDEGAANHMRLCERHDRPGIEVFVYGEGGGAFPARQNRIAAAALARRHGLSPERTLLARQSDAAIAAGAFHNDVVAVANETVLLTHGHAFADREGVYASIQACVPGAIIVEAPADRVPLADAITSYLFNSQLVTLPDDGGMLLLLPEEARRVPSVVSWLEEVVAAGGPIRRIEFMDLRESMRNGGGPACLRLRVLLSREDFAAIDPRFVLDISKCDALAELIAEAWPEQIAPHDIGDPALWRRCWSARARLLDILGFEEGEL